MMYKGKVKSGFGNASFWMEKISKAFENKYEIKPFLGTLNVKLNGEYILNTDEKILAHEYGGDFDVLVSNCKVLGNKSYILRTEKNNTKDGDHSLEIIEIVSNVNFRKTYNLKDGDIIEIELDK
ncbi:MAG: DUF120 domain-containing protein [Clostridia bacterium]|nr:DUF120 domain-containing protein [Clostridia bacterium]